LGPTQRADVVSAQPHALLRTATAEAALLAWSPTRSGSRAPPCVWKCKEPVRGHDGHTPVEPAIVVSVHGLEDVLKAPALTVSTAAYLPAPPDYTTTRLCGQQGERACASVVPSALTQACTPSRTVTGALMHTPKANGFAHALFVHMPDRSDLFGHRAVQRGRLQNRTQRRCARAHDRVSLHMRVRLCVRACMCLGMHACTPANTGVL
jgi:hypothetical protein